MSTTGGAPKKASRKKTADAAQWQTGSVPDTTGERIRFVNSCTKQLRESMKQDTRTNSNKTPFHHPIMTCNQSPTTLHQQHYEAFPACSAVAVPCTFCRAPIAVADVLCYHKNQYTRMPWTAICDGCAEKTAF